MTGPEALLVAGSGVAAFAGVLAAYRYALRGGRHRRGKRRRGLP